MMKNTDKYYLDNDPALYAVRDKTRDLVWEINNLKPSMNEKRMELFAELLGEMGEGVFIEAPFSCDIGKNISFGDHSYAAMNLSVLDCAPVKIGKRVLIGPNVAIYTTGHALDAEERAEGYVCSDAVEIEDDVWISGSAVILKGVKIGKGSVVGAGSVVTKDIPEGVIAVGNPCKVVRKITAEDKIKRT